MTSVAVIGAGIAGLAVAHRLRTTCEVDVFEASARAGGKIRSQREDGFLFEWGPNGYLSSAAPLAALVTDAGLDSERCEARPSGAERFIYWNRRLHRLPSKPPQALGMSLLSLPAKLRALRELWVRPADGPESVFAFVERRFGRQAAERIVAPALLGISGGDAGRTSLDAVFPRLRALEHEYGSVLRGLTRSRGSRAKLITFAGAGMQRLTDRLAEALGDRLHLNAPVTAIEPRNGGWQVTCGTTRHDADRIVIAAPADVAARCVAGFDAALAAALESIPYAPMRVVGLAYRAADLRSALDGFGVLAARGQGVRSLGVLFASSMFPDQAPPGTVLLRVFLGGAFDPAAVALDAAAARDVARTDLAQLLGIEAEPLKSFDAVWPRAIPQYGLGHADVLRAVADAERRHPGLALAGNAYRGLGVGDDVADALAVAGRITAG